MKRQIRTRPAHGVNRLLNGARSSGKALLSVVEPHSTAVAVTLTALAVGALIGWTLATSGPEVGDWDYLFLSGCLVTLAGLWLARGQHESFESMFERLVNRGALAADPPLTKPVIATLQKELSDRTARWSSRLGIALAALIAITWAVVNVTRDQDARLFDQVAGPLVGALGGYLVGRVLGRMLSYGLLGPFLSKRRVTFRVIPEHVDGAAGLKPVGDYYLFQALLLTLPAIFLLVWSLIFLLPDWADRYGSWRETYLGLLALAIALEIAAFVAPMWHAHVAMKKEKHNALKTADTKLADDIAEVRAELAGKLSVDDRSVAHDRLDHLTARYEAIETMPTWPVDRALRRRVTLGNAGLILGLVAQVAALTGWS